MGLEELGKLEKRMLRKLYSSPRNIDDLTSFGDEKALSHKLDDMLRSGYIEKVVAPDSWVEKMGLGGPEVYFITGAGEGLMGYERFYGLGDGLRGDVEVPKALGTAEALYKVMKVLKENPRFGHEVEEVLAMPEATAYRQIKLLREDFGGVVSRMMNRNTRKIHPYIIDFPNGIKYTLTKRQEYIVTSGKGGPRPSLHLLTEEFKKISKKHDEIIELAGDPSSILKRVA